MATLAEVLAVLQEQQGLGEVGPVEGVVGQEVGVERAAAGQGQFGGEHDGHGSVGGRGHDRRAADGS